MKYLTKPFTRKIGHDKCIHLHTKISIDFIFLRDKFYIGQLLFEFENEFQGYRFKFNVSC